MKILVVEDQPDSRHTFSKLLEMRGHEVSAVATAEEAERALAEDSFPFLILDWMLPGKSGVELCRELRSRVQGDEMFILLVTARSDQGDLELALDAGADDYLTKPLDLARLNIRLAVAERQIRQLRERNQARRDLQESARTLADILENTTDGFFALDYAWRFSYLNPEAETLLGRSRDELMGGELWEKFPELCGTVFEKNYRRVMARQEPVEFEACDAAGRTWFEVHAYPSGGGVSAFFRDVTERKRVEDDRLTTGKLESLGTLAGGIAHDLNNILTVISGNIGLAQLEAPTDGHALLGCLNKAAQAAQQAANLSSQLLTFSKGGTPVKKVVSVGELLSKATNFALHGSSLRAEVDVPSDLWSAEVDPAQIEQVINALLINAREAMPNGGTVEVSARNVQQEGKPGAVLAAGRYLKICIADQGTGVPDALQTKIFDPYFTTKSASSGLGLSISFSIIKKHGGLLHLEHSSPGGAMFAIYLPAAKTEPAAEKKSHGVPSLNFNAQRILVMDDEEGIRDLTAALLSTLGYEVVAVSDGVEAVKTYERAMRRGENFQAVILDATIRGGMGGLATIERLRNIDPSVVAVICSGYSDEAALAEFLRFGFRAALPKPFTRRDLADVLQRAFLAAKNQPVLC
ncbi:MAG: response regulator [Verrucomicrobiota bacterium]|nr:response regulator [Verrucomicrobiota bacterium]